MKKIFLSKNMDGHQNAGRKARVDADDILLKNGYTKCMTSKDYKNKTVQKVLNYMHYNSMLNLSPDSIVFNQYPDFSYNFYKVMKQKKEKCGFKVVTLIHDLSVREKETEFNNLEKQQMVLDMSDVIIVHNTFMKEYMKTQGIPEEKMICLEIFDYLIPEEMPGSDANLDKNKVIIAGNLSKEKSEYIYSLYKAVKNVRFNLYGAPYEGPEAEDHSTDYHGSFSPEELIKAMNGGWGLVWDGPSLDTCEGSYGQYLKINNPHKTSLYLASQRPIIIWKEAALASFVQEKKVGIAVESLYELEERIQQMSEEEYAEILQNMRGESEKLRNGYYLTQAIKKAEEMVRK